MTINQRHHNRHFLPVSKPLCLGATTNENFNFSLANGKYSENSWCRNGNGIWEFDPIQLLWLFCCFALARNRQPYFMLI